MDFFPIKYFILKIHHYKIESKLKKIRLIKK